MANALIGWPIYSDAGVVYSPTLSGGSWESALPLANLQDRRLAKVARSTDLSRTSLIILVDLGIPRAVRLVGFPKANIRPPAGGTQGWRVRALVNNSPVLDDLEFGSWTDEGTPIKTTGQTDPWSANQATLIEDNDGAAFEGIFKDTPFTTDGIKGIAVTIKEGTAPITSFGIYDNTVATWRHLIHATWSGGVPTLSTADGAGTLYTPVAAPNGFYHCVALVNGVVESASNLNYFRLRPTSGTDASATGTSIFYEAMAWDVATQPVLYDSSVVAPWPSGIDLEESEGMNVGFLNIFDETTARFWRIELDDSANSDSYVELGRLAICGGWQPTINLAGGAALGLQTETSRQVTDGGAAIYTERPQRRLFTGVLPHLPEDEALASGFDMQRIAGKAGQLYFVYDPDDTTHLHRRAFLAVHRELGPFQDAILARYGVPLALIEEL